MRNAATILRSTWKSFNLSERLPLAKGGASDKILLLLSISLAAFGLVMVYSSSYILSQEKYGDGLHYFNRHLVFLGVGFLAMIVCRFVDISFWKKYGLALFIFSLGLLLLTQVPGIRHRAGGASRWINLGGFTMQPVEFAKIALVMFLASRLSEKIDFDDIREGFVKLLWPSVVLIGLCMIQPDFGSSALIIATTALLLYTAGVRLKFLLGSALAVVPFVAGALLMAPYRRARLLTFLDPWADPQGSGFQIVQSFIAFYRGGLFGVGLGNSKAKIFYLPEAHNDFILSVVGEELGFLGIGILSMAFLLLIFRGIRAAARAETQHAALLASGLTVLLGFELFWNAAIVLGLFPTKGMNLPFISSGGSSIICALSIVGILLNISAQSRRDLSFR